jgi:hypothetical protein
MNLYRMALTEAGLSKGYLQSIGVPKPSNTYKAYSSQLPKSTGGQKTNWLQKRYLAMD